MPWHTGLTKYIEKILGDDGGQQSLYNPYISDLRVDVHQMEDYCDN
jgi:hypothetical protein